MVTLVVMMDGDKLQEPLLVQKLNFPDEVGGHLVRLKLLPCCLTTI
jgi:hypothetical protein